jgi:hypothetical protein
MGFDLIALSGWLSLMGPSFAGDPAVYLRGDGAVVHEQAPGYGNPVAPGDRLTIEFVMRDASGAPVAGSSMRGLPFTFVLPGADSLLGSLAAGMRMNGRRTLHFGRMPEDLQGRPLGPATGSPNSLELRIAGLVRSSPSPEPAPGSG